MHLYEFNWSRLAAMLKSFRELSGRTQKEVQEKLLELLKSNGSTEWNEFQRIVDSENGGSLAKLEAGGRIRDIIQLPDIGPLAEAYGIHRPLFDSLLAKPVEDIFLHHRCSDDFMEVDHSTQPSNSSEATYKIPVVKLRGTDDIDIVHLVLKGGGSSTRHMHPGDEILYVLNDGAVEVQMEDTGLQAKLEKDDFIHFDAEQNHSIYSCSQQDVELLVIRFFQFHSGERRKLSKKLSKSKSSQKVITRVIKDMRVSGWKGLDQKRFNEPKEIFDRFGLGRFLQLLTSPNFAGGHYGLSLNTLAEKAHIAGYKEYERSDFARLHNGEARVKREELPTLAGIYGVRPMLLYNFLFPVFPYAIAIHGQADMRSVELDLPNGVTYMVPCRCLAFSGVTIALVILEQDAATPENRHPAYEFLQPLEGEVQVEFDRVVRGPIREGEYCVFDSSKMHRVRNSGCTQAKVLAIRFLQ
jgi:quercetin dioxygenase-like cupin family protein